eukprot:5164914-Lingulodinium_polyedra.AAC.1
MTPRGAPEDPRADCLRLSAIRGGSVWQQSGFQPSSPSRARPFAAPTPSIDPLRRNVSSW